MDSHIHVHTIVFFLVFNFIHTRKMSVCFVGFVYLAFFIFFFSFLFLLNVRSTSRKEEGDFRWCVCECSCTFLP